MIWILWGVWRGFEGPGEEELFFFLDWHDGMAKCRLRSRARRAAFNARKKSVCIVAGLEMRRQPAQSPKETPQTTGLRTGRS